MTVNRQNRLLAIGAVIVLIVALASAGVVWAQAQAGAAGKGHRMGGAFGAGPMMMLNRLAQKLNITDQQKQQIHDILASHKADIRSLVDEGFAAHEALNQAVIANNSAAIGTAVNQLSNVERSGAQLKAQLRAQIWGSVLNADQRTQADQLLTQFQQKAAARHQRIDQFIDGF